MVLIKYKLWRITFYVFNCCVIFNTNCVKLKILIKCLYAFFLFTYIKMLVKHSVGCASQTQSPSQLDSITALLLQYSQWEKLSAWYYFFFVGFFNWWRLAVRFANHGLVLDKAMISLLKTFFKFYDGFAFVRHLTWWTNLSIVTLMIDLLNYEHVLKVYTILKA